MPSCMLSQIFTYPVKSLKGVSHEALSLTAMGPSNDRRYMVVDEYGRFLTQRQIPEMTLIKAELYTDGLRLSLAGEDDLQVDASDRSDVFREVTVWNDSVQAQDCGECAALWLSACLKKKVRLVYMPGNIQRGVDPHYGQSGDIVSFADGFPLLLISEASLENLNSRLAQPVSIDRFRPNIVIKGCKPHEEDRWKKIRIGSEEFDIVKPCSRCVIPSIDPATAEKNPQIIRELTKYRRGDDKKVYFGQNLIHRTRGRLLIGDQLEVLA